MTKNVCIYHGVDLDGYCSAAIWYRATSGGKMLIPMNYGCDIPWDELNGANVTMVDFSFQPWSNFVRLMEVSRSLTWIDHHKSAIDEFNLRVPCEPPELVSVCVETDQAACELTWDYYYPDSDMPRGVHLLGDYDCWRHSMPETMAYQMGMRYEGMENPADVRWDRVFADDEDFYSSVLSTGDIIREWDDRQSARIVSSTWFPAAFDGLRWMAVNRGMLNSMFWDSVWDDSYDGMLGFSWSRRGYWSVSLYSPKIDCGAIAKRYGGGGHPGAAGFQYHGDNIFDGLLNQIHVVEE